MYNYFKLYRIGNMYKLSTRYELNLTMGIKGHFGVESVLKIE